MYDPADTICAPATAPLVPGAIAKTIIRISGPQTLSIIHDVFSAETSITPRTVVPGSVRIDGDILIDAHLWFFAAPHSYTAEDLAELHLFAAPAVIDSLVESVCTRARIAHPGEFTLRAYLNGRIDLSQAEAVAQIVAGSNTLQINAAHKLLAGSLSRTAARLKLETIDLLSLIEAGLDFSTEDIEFISTEDASRTVENLIAEIDSVIKNSVHCEEMIDLPSVGLTGLSNAGKTSLLNALLGSLRGIVSPESATTRDVLTALLDLPNSRCIIFDSAGLAPAPDDSPLIEQLAQKAALEALNSADLIGFCVDASKDDFSLDLQITNHLQRKPDLVIVTKIDLLDQTSIDAGLDELNTIFGCNVIPTSTITDSGMDRLRKAIDSLLASLYTDSAEIADRIAINNRHRRLVSDTLAALASAADEIARRSDELAAMFLRSAAANLSELTNENISDDVLERIFSKFCIGK
jgi:tRNA modification GTPase